MEPATPRPRSDGVCPTRGAHRDPKGATRKASEEDIQKQESHTAPQGLIYRLPRAFAPQLPCGVSWRSSGLRLLQQRS